MSSPVPLDVPPTLVELNQFSLLGSEASVLSWLVHLIAETITQRGCRGFSNPFISSRKRKLSLPDTKKHFLTVIRVGSFRVKTGNRLNQIIRIDAASTKHLTYRVT